VNQKVFDFGAIAGAKRAAAPRPPQRLMGQQKHFAFLGEFENF